MKQGSGYSDHFDPCLRLTHETAFRFPGERNLAPSDSFNPDNRTGSGSLIRAWRSVSRADAGEAPGFGLHHGAEVVAAQRALLFQVGAYRGEVVVGQHFAQQLSVGLGVKGTEAIHFG